MRSRRQGHCSVASALRASLRRGDTLVTTRPSFCPCASELVPEEVAPLVLALVESVPFEHAPVEVVSRFCSQLSASFVVFLACVSLWRLSAFLLELRVVHLSFTGTFPSAIGESIRKAQANMPPTRHRRKADANANAFTTTYTSP